MRGVYLTSILVACSAFLATERDIEIAIVLRRWQGGTIVYSLESTLRDLWHRGILQFREIVPQVMPPLDLGWSFRLSDQEVDREIYAIIWLFQDITTRTKVFPHSS
jgi:hypothetical protein